MIRGGGGRYFEISGSTFVQRTLVMRVLRRCGKVYTKEGIRARTRTVAMGFREGKAVRTKERERQVGEEKTGGGAGEGRWEARGSYEKGRE